MLDNRLQGNFVSKNVVNLSRRNLTRSEISLLSKRLNFVPTSNTIHKAKRKTELEAYGRILRLKWHFRNEENEFAIEVYMSSLEEKLKKLRHQRTNITILLVKNDKFYPI